jgi:hypothetical protein
VYFGFSAGLQLLDVASFSLALHRNDFARCSVILSTGSNIFFVFFSGGNVYGGGVSVYIGGYSSSFNLNGIAVAAVGDTVVRNASVRVETATFTSCSATTTGNNGANSYGGSFSLYLGGYAWNFGKSSSSSGSSSSGGGSSTSGLTTASGVSVSISNVNSSGCSAKTTGIHGGNSYGGSMSVVHIGAYAWSNVAGGSSFSSSSLSSCGTTNVTGLVVFIGSSTFADSSADSRTFHKFPLFSFFRADLHSSAENPILSGFSYISNVSAFAISSPSIILPLCMRRPLMQGAGVRRHHQHHDRLLLVVVFFWNNPVHCTVWRYVLQRLRS